MSLRYPNPATTELARLRELFETSAELAPNQRELFFAEQCLSTNLRDLLEAMLSADIETQDVFAIPVAVWADQLQPVSAAPEALVGTSVGGFHIVALLGQGGSSVVFSAQREVAGATQTVALKLLRNGLFSTDAQRRFRREQSILTQLSHQNIAHLIDAGISDAGIPYIAMERVDGLALTEYADRHSLDQPSRLRLLAELAMTVDAAHRALIVHRDLKPSNVLVNAAGQIKVLDFGVAKLLGEEVNTATQHISLTPGYAAPEQYHSGPVTTAVDVYALGVIAGELLVGARLGVDAVVPREGDNVEAARQRWRCLDPDLATFLRAALAADPALRYASARQYADDIERYLHNEPIAARAPSQGYRARKFIARHRVMVFASSGFVLALLAALGVALWEAGNARAQAARADSMRDFMFDAFAEAEPSVPREGPVTVLDAVRRAIVISRADTSTDARTRFELRTRLAQVLQRQGDIDGAGEIFSETLAAAISTLGADDSLSYEIAELTAQNTMTRGEFEAARVQVDALLERLRDEPGEMKIQLLSLSAVLATKVRERERALIDGRESVTLARRLGDAEVLRQTLNDFGAVLLNVDAVPEAVSVYEEELALDRQRFGEQHLKVANTQAGLARAYRRSGDLSRAERAASAAVAIDRAIYPGPNANLALHLNSLMMALDANGDLVGALAAAREALTINRATLGDTHPETLVALYGVGSLEIKLEAYAVAVPLLYEALVGSEQRFGVQHWATAVRRSNYGFALAMRGQVEAGTQELERAIADLSALADPDLDKLSASIDKRIRLALNSGDPATARYWLARLERYSPSAPVSRASWPGNVDTLRGAILLASQQASQAIVVLTRADKLMASAINADATLRAEHSLLLASAWFAGGNREQALRVASIARTQVEALRFVPQRLVALDLALPR